MRSGIAQFSLGDMSHRAGGEREVVGGVSGRVIQSNCAVDGGLRGQEHDTGFLIKLLLPLFSGS